MQEMGTSAWQSVRFARESSCGNPRVHGMAALRARRRGEAQQRADYGEILERVDEGISHLENLTRTLREANYAEGEWDEKFRERWSMVMRDAGAAIADPDADVAPVPARLRALAPGLAGAARRPAPPRPPDGARIRSMQHIAVVVDDVASAREARETA